MVLLMRTFCGIAPWTSTKAEVGVYDRQPVLELWLRTASGYPLLYLFAVNVSGGIAEKKNE